MLCKIGCYVLAVAAWIGLMAAWVVVFSVYPGLDEFGTGVSRWIAGRVGHTIMGLGAFCITVRYAWVWGLWFQRRLCTTQEGP